MIDNCPINFDVIRDAMKAFELTVKVEPNESIELARAFFPEGHRGILDLRRQLVVGNRGMGKSFWTHALLNKELRMRLSSVYKLPALATANVHIGFNGSDKLHDVAPTTDEIAAAVGSSYSPDVIWRAVILRSAYSVIGKEVQPFRQVISDLNEAPHLYAETLTAVDDILVGRGETLLIVFDALDRLAQDWTGIRDLTKALLMRAVGLQSFQSIRAKIFMRVDQFSDDSLFAFPDSSKIRNDHVNLIWSSYELYGLLLFELMREDGAGKELKTLADRERATLALPNAGRLNASSIGEQNALITSIGGEFMGNHKKRGRVYSWVPLHLSDASDTCSPRTFLTAWKTAANHVPAPTDRVVDHNGLIDGVRTASGARLRELREDYPWIDPALKALKRQLVPMPLNELFLLWTDANVLQSILKDARNEPKNAPIGLHETNNLQTLLNVMKSIAVMEERANGKINVPDIFRVEAEILRKGGVAVPRRR